MRNFKKLLALLLSVATVPCFATDIGGVISTNTTLTFINSPYTVTSNLLVAAGARLTVEPGVVIKFNTNMYMQVLGEFQALGKADSLIKIDRVSTNNMPGYEGWHGIRVASSAIDYDSATSAGTILNYVEIGGYQESGAPENSIIRTDSVNILISNCRFYNGDEGTAISFVNSEGIVKNSQFFNTEGPQNNNGKFYMMVYVDNIDSMKPAIIKDNEFVNEPFVISRGFAEIRNGVFTGNRFTGSRSALKLMGHCVVTNNIFEEGGVAIEIRENPLNSPYGLQQIIRCNIFRNSETNLKVSACKAWPVFEYNYLMGSAATKVSFIGGCPNSGVSQEISFANNYWGTTDSATIETFIQDFNADFSSVKNVNFMPVLTDSTPVCPEPEDTTTTGIEDMTSLAGNIQIYPNPFSGSCTISLDAELLNRHADLSISIYNMLGQEIFSTLLNQKQVAVESSELNNSKGVLFYTIRSKGIAIRSGKLLAK